MPSALKARAGKPSVTEMKSQLAGLRKPLASTMEALYSKYHQICLAEDPPLQELPVKEDGINWKALILSLPTPENTKVLGCGIRRVLFKRADCIYDGIYRFHVERRDLTQAMFEFRDAYDDPYHHYKDKSFKDDVDTALRAAILPHIVQFKELHCKDSQMELVSHISGIALPWEKAVVQHFPVTFRVLLDAFLNENQIELESIKLEFCEDHGYKLKDPVLLDKWRLFHRSHAQYRIISTDEAMEQEPVKRPVKAGVNTVRAADSTARHLIQVARVLKEAIEEGKSKADLEVMVESRYQDSVVLLLSCTPRMGRDDAIAGAICIGQDITRMKELDVKRSNIAATVTHELRSPLHGIIGLSEQLVSTGADARQKRQLKMISHCARRLLDLVMNIMDLSTLVQSKRLRLARDPVQMGKLIEEVQVLLSSAVDKAKRPIKKDTVRLIIDVPDQLPIIEADAHRCMQMLYNLVTNAFKYTKEGVVEVMARADDAKEILTVHVRDTGIGISPAACERVFLPFEQEDQDDNRQFEGMGLGLAISREVAVKHGGPWMGGGRVFFPARDHDMTTMTTGQR
ncbi:Hybrid signal transduction histidine kinase A [Durusdinium trenchii]|uniref:histidine kinase n=1 Tax=Durusdinium trenchii TaxID=1381693 RepID=A0ABP0LB04_9DINO